MTLKDKILLAVGVAAAISFSSCYNQRKATAQFSKAAIAYPELPADYCARTYPPKTNIVKGDTVTHFDTLYTGGETFFDTVRVKGDTIRITKTVQLPGTLIKEKYFIHDTLSIENTAALDLCNIERRKIVDLLTKKTAEYDKWRKIAKQRFFIILGLGLLITISIVWKVYKMFYGRK